MPAISKGGKLLHLPRSNLTMDGRMQETGSHFQLFYFDRWHIIGSLAGRAQGCDDSRKKVGRLVNKLVS